MSCSEPVFHPILTSRLHISFVAKRKMAETIFMAQNVHRIRGIKFFCEKIGLKNSVTMKILAIFVYKAFLYIYFFFDEKNYSNSVVCSFFWRHRVSNWNKGSDAIIW